MWHRAIRQRTRSALVAAQLALAVLLLSGAGLVLRSFYNLSRVDLGFREDVVTMSFALDENSYPSAASIHSFTHEFDSRLLAAPGMISAGFSTSLPLTGQGWGNPVTVEGKPLPPSAAAGTARFQCVSPHYFEALGTPLRQGRHLSADDDTRSALVTLVDETFARIFLNDGGPAIGRRLKIGGASSTDPWRTIVGVVAASRQITLEGPPEPHVYLPYAQLGDLVRMVGRGIYVAARSSMPPTATIGALKAQVASLDRNLPVRETQVLKERVDSALAPEKFRAILMSGFAALAVILAAVGLYGVIAFAVSQRAPEIGVRMALGADAARIRHLVIGDGLRVAAAGLACGIAGALVLSRFVEGMLFGVPPRDLPTLIAVAVMLAVVAVVASYLPARRASRIDPMRALRSD